MSRRAILFVLALAAAALAAGFIAAAGDDYR
jgi:hypothetical protein